MYAIFRAAGKQFRAEKGKTLRLPLMDAAAGSKVTFDEVLLSSDGDTIRAGAPLVAGADPDLLERLLAPLVANAGRYARSQVVLAAAASGRTGPIDGPYPALDDVDGLVGSSTAARALGFTGKVVLHPRQIEPVRAAFAPTEAELDRAREILAAHEAAGDAGAFRLGDGTFVDRPVLLRAAALLEVEA
jgi:citrate lyase beta subunit